MRKVKLPEVTKEEAEATFMVLFTTPLKRFGLVEMHTKADTQRQTSSYHKENLHTMSGGEEHHCFKGECCQCVCVTAAKTGYTGTAFVVR